MAEKSPNPLDYLIEVCESGHMPSKFDIFSAKNELKYLRGGIDYLNMELKLLKENRYNNQDFK